MTGTVNLTTAQTDTITLKAVDAVGDAITLTPDAPPTWTNSDPTVCSTALSTDHMTNTVTPLTEGTTTIGVSLTVNSVPFTDSTVENVVATSPGLSVTTLSAVITGLGDGLTHTVNASDGTDMGDYVGEFVTQHCVRCFIPNTDFTIFFRRDANGQRPEIVVERGQAPTQTITPAQIQSTYTVQFYDGATLLATINPTAHWYYARWRWPNTPRPVVRDVATLLSRKWIPAYTNTSGLNCAPYTTSANLKLYVNPMDVCQILWDGTTGERPEIGLLTEWQVDYMLNGTAVSLQQIMSHAEANASIPIHARDQTTGAPFSVQAHPYYTLSSASGTNKLSWGPQPIDPATGKVDKRWRAADSAHHPDLCSLPWMLTDDPYYMEEMQFTGNFTTLQSGFFPNQFKLPGLAELNQPRGMGWGMRDQFRNAKFAPASPPSWLLPQSYWAQNLADTKTYIGLVMASPAKVYTLFHFLSHADEFAMWQRGYASVVMAHGVAALGFTDWQTEFDWQFAAIANQYNGTSGWNPSFPMPDTNNHNVMSPFLDSFASVYVADTSKDSDTVASIAAKYAQIKAYLGYDDSAWDPLKLYTNQAGPDFTCILYAALKTAIACGHTEASALVTKLQNAWTNVMHFDGTFNYNTTKGQGNMKWSF